MANLGAALGQAIGKLVEEKITTAISRAAEQRGYTAKAKRLRNGQGNQYKIDCVVSDAGNNPVIIVDIKYIRYKKHNRDKGSWLCTAHYNLRKTFPTIRKSLTVLFGSWSSPSKALIRNFGIEIHEVSFPHLVSVLDSRGIDFDWPEADSLTPRKAWDAFLQLDYVERAAIGAEIVGPILKNVVTSVETTLDTDLVTMQRRVQEVELLLKTSHDEFLLYSYPSVSEAVNQLVRLLTDRPDIPNIQDLLKQY